MMVVFPTIGAVNILPVIDPFRTGNESGLAVGVMVVDPTTISGIEAEPEG